MTIPAHEISIYPDQLTAYVTVEDAAVDLSRFVRCCVDKQITFRCVMIDDESFRVFADTMSHLELSYKTVTQVMMEVKQ